MHEVCQSFLKFTIFIYLLEEEERGRQRCTRTHTQKARMFGMESGFPKSCFYWRPGLSSFHFQAKYQKCSGGPAESSGLPDASTCLRLCSRCPSLLPLEKENSGPWEGVGDSDSPGRPKRCCGVGFGPGRGASPTAIPLTPVPNTEAGRAS